ncbi:hypothetical protein GGS23DRAFT_593196 [Durotheca rogersii]|uniref:uncharacterized protein n=1 Tax=Durotheca rogersii TaxID=419775 RepID=UPI002220E201|nr:uncharacterized protein GGS23DRAFT_593196 [Durotheca rogersii]KAI5866448.1 hypothetical protein GGS23DRAFT_593196 [Durotheca rogersii]
MQPIAHLGGEFVEEGVVQPPHDEDRRRKHPTVVQMGCATLCGTSTVRISVLCSGNGTNLQALIDSCASDAPDSIPGKIVKVTVSRKGAYATTRAEKAGIPTDYFHPVKDGYQTLGEKDAGKLNQARLQYDATVCIPPRPSPNQIVPELEDGTTGIVIRYVVAEVDRGEPILVRKIKIEAGESLEALEQKIRGHEHGLIVQATALLAEEIASKKASRK